MECYIMKKKKIILIISLLVVFILIFIVSWFIISFNNDRKETLKKMDNISILYDDFKNRVDSFNTIREDIYANVLSNVYYDTLIVNYDVWTNKLINYEEFIDNIDKDFENLKKYCDGVYYPELEINNKCQSFIIAYEEINNSFVSDIEVFNKNIEDYNVYIKEQNSNEILKKYSTNKKYIDYNHDKEYFGKDDENNNE